MLPSAPLSDSRGKGVSFKWGFRRRPLGTLLCVFNARRADAPGPLLREHLTRVASHGGLSPFGIVYHRPILLHGRDRAGDRHPQINGFLDNLRYLGKGIGLTSQRGTTGRRM